MRIWQRFVDSIFDAPFGKVTPADKAAARARGAAINWTDQEVEAHIEYGRRMTRNANHGKLWTLGAGNTLHLTDFPITINRVDEDQQMTFGGRFRVDCNGLTPSFAWTLEDAKFVGERWAREIDALPLAQKECREERGETAGVIFDNCHSAQYISIINVGMVLIYGREIARLRQAGMTPEEAIRRRMATVENFTFKFKDDAVRPGEGSSVKTEG